MRIIPILLILCKRQSPRHPRQKYLLTEKGLALYKEESNVRRHILNAFREGELERDENNVQKIHVNGVTFGGATLSARKAV